MSNRDEIDSLLSLVLTDQIERDSSNQYEILELLDYTDIRQ